MKVTAHGTNCVFWAWRSAIYALWQYRFAVWFPLDNYGDLTVAPWLNLSGMLAWTVRLTNTLSVSVACYAVNQSRAMHISPWYGLTIVAETWEGTLNDIHGGVLAKNLIRSRSGNELDSLIGFGSNDESGWNKQPTQLPYPKMWDT